MSRLASSFRDPSGFVFKHDRCIYRQINTCFSAEYDHFLDSGLYDALVKRGILIDHQDVTGQEIPRTQDCYRLIKPAQVPFISYPYEWSFSQLKDAAILTLKAQAEALKHGFVLKDASAYNVQFVDSKPVFIDTLSFELHEEGRPWVAYRQFCQHFLAPLALMAHVDIDLGKMLVTHIDGIPLSLASKLLPTRTRFSYALQMHIHLHAKMQAEYANTAGEPTSSNVLPKESKKATVSISGLAAINEGLASAVHKLKWKPLQTEWGDYYAHTNYSEQAAKKKQELVGQFLADIDSPLSVIQDFGANSGAFSRIAACHAKLVVSQDIDPVAVERNYQQCKANSPRNLLPLIQNLFCPSPAIGWENLERDSFRQRARCDAVMALALIHHLAISNNTPLTNIAEFFASLADWLIIEFIPKSDSQVSRLLETREDIFPSYTQEGFELAFEGSFSTERKEAVAGSDRLLYLMKSR